MGTKSPKIGIYLQGSKQTFALRISVCCAITTISTIPNHVQGHILVNHPVLRLIRALSRSVFLLLILVVPHLPGEGC